MGRKKLSDYVKEKTPDDTSIDSVGETKEVLVDSNTPFLPSIFEQVEVDKSQIASRPVLDTPSEDVVQLDAEDIEMLMELPFDLAASLTKFPNWQLSTKETKALSKLWIRPLRRWLKDVDNLDVYMAALVTVTIFGEKALEYKIEERKRKQSSLTSGSTGDAGTGQN